MQKNMSDETISALSIACLGWGSLVWDPRGLPIQGGWQEDGPLLPLEFARQSDDGRITLVIVPGAAPLTTLWARMTLGEVAAAKEALAAREGIRGVNRLSKIGGWQHGEMPPALMPDLADWAHDRNLDAAIWTALQPGLEHVAGPPSAGDVLSYLRSLEEPTRSRAKEYVERAPRQIDTAYRRGIESKLGWLSARSGIGEAEPEGTAGGI